MKKSIKTAQGSYMISLNAPSETNPVTDVLAELDEQMFYLGLLFKRGLLFQIYWSENGQLVPQTDPRIKQVPLNWNHFKKTDPDTRTQMFRNAVIPVIQRMELPVIAWE